MDTSVDLRQRRLAAGLTQRDLARLGGTSASAVNRYERGRVSPSVRTLDRLLAACSQSGHRRWSSFAQLAPAMAVEFLTGRPLDAWRLVGEVIDDDRTRSAEELLATVAERPSDTGEDRVDATVAALAEWLCVRRGLVPPPWTQEPARVARRWWFVTGDPAFHAMAFRESPISFARRGIFVTRGGLERV